MVTMVNFMLCEFCLNRKKKSNSYFVLVFGMSINHTAYREGEKSSQDLIDHYEQKKKEIIKNRGKLVFKKPLY